jgi:hypothetical protein
MRPADVWGWVSRPRSSNAPIADRTVAGLAGSPKRRTNTLLPTGSTVST